MRNFLLTPLYVAALAACARPADPPKAAPVDTSFLKRYAETRGFMLGRPAKPKIVPDGKAVLFLRSGPTKAKQSLFEFDVATGKTRELLSPEALLQGAGENLTPEEKARRERQRVTVGGFANYQLDDTGKRVLLMLSGRVYVFDRASGKARELKTGPGTIVDPKWSPNGKYVSYVRDHDVYVCDLSADAERAVTTGGTALKTHGLAEFVAQEEMGRFTGYWWSPDSTRIAYEEADHAGVEVWRIADPFRPGVKPREQFYPRPGKKNVSVRLGVVPIEGGRTVWVKWDRTRYEYLVTAKWDVSGGLAAVLQGRKQQFLTLLHARKSSLTMLAQEKDPDWVNVADNIPMTAGGDYFLWPATDRGRTEYQIRNWRDGKIEMIAIPAEEKPLELVSAYPPTAPNPFGSGPKWRYGIAYFISVPDPTQRQLKRANITFGTGMFGGTPGSRIEQLTTEPGLHSGVFAPIKQSADKLAVITSTTLNKLPHSDVFKIVYNFAFGQPTPKPAPPPAKPVEHQAKLEKVGELPSVAEEPPFKPNVKIEKVGDYWTAIVRPRDFDATKKYPVIVHVYGGPKHLTVVRAMRNWLVPQWLADQGFVVVAIDNRGTPGRGRDWERAVYQKFGTVPLEDQVKGLHLLCDKYPELDRERVGIVGWSFGGYMAANAVLRRPDVFRAAVAGAPVTDWEDYDTHYTERYLGLLPESQKAYDEASLIPLAKNLRRPLLLVHGTADDNVYFRHTLKLANALFRAGRPFEVLPLPGVTHMYTADPQVTERLWAKTVAFFKTHLGEAK